MVCCHGKQHCLSTSDRELLIMGKIEEFVHMDTRHYGNCELEDTLGAWQ